MKMKLQDEARRLTRVLKGKAVQTVWRHRLKEVGIEFADGTRLFVDWRSSSRLEFSVTAGRSRQG